MYSFTFKYIHVSYPCWKLSNLNISITIVKHTWAAILHVPGLQCVNPLLCLLIVHMDLRRVPSGQKPGAVRINGNIQCLSNFIDCMKALPWCVMPKFDQTWGIWNLEHNLLIISAKDEFFIVSKVDL